MKIDAYAERLKRDVQEATHIRNIILFAFGIILLLSCLARPSNAYMTVSISTGTPETVEQQLLFQIANQFNASIVVNPLAANTYQVKLFGMNPSYISPKVSTDLVTLNTIAEKLMSISSDTYIYGFRDGMAYGRDTDLGLISNYIDNCSSATYFDASTPATWSSSTCDVSLGNASEAIFKQNLSTPTIIPPIVPPPSVSSGTCPILTLSKIAYFSGAGQSNWLVNVTAPNQVCSWSVTSTVPWIAVISQPTVMVGDGLFSVEVLTNAGAARTGTFSVGLASFTVAQEAAPGF